MNADLEALIPLQETDLQMKQLREAIAALPRHLAALEEKLRTQASTLEGAEKSLKDEEARRRRLESDVKDHQQKITKFRDQLSGVKTNEQYTALQHEINFAQAEIRKIEDVELDSMERTEALEAQRRNAQTELAGYKKLVEREKEEARATSAEQTRKLEALTGQRDQLRAKVSASVLSNYDRIASGRGSGLARAQQQKCTACQMFQRPQMWNQIRNGELLTCESCGRILYFDPAMEPAAAEVIEPEKERPRRPRNSATAES